MTNVEIGIANVALFMAKVQNRMANIQNGMANVALSSVAPGHVYWKSCSSDISQVLCI